MEQVGNTAMDALGKVEGGIHCAKKGAAFLEPKIPAKTLMLKLLF